MAGGKLASAVPITGPDGATVWFKPGDEVPEWAASLIGNAKAWAEPPTPSASEAALDEGQQARYRRFDGAIAANPDANQADYESLTVLELRALVKSRNEGRDAEAKISGEGNKAALIKALEADDRA